MRIGIISMQKIHNYGSFLQAYSLKHQLEKRGHDVYFVDILPGRQIVPMPSYEGGIRKYLSKFDRYVLKRVENYFFFKKMTRIHIDDYEQYLETAKTVSDGERFDLVIIGSDEVFNATAPSGWGFSTQLFGDVNNADRVVTYAASCGSTTVKRAMDCGIEGDLKRAMSNLEHISVRDVNTAEFARAFTDTDVQMHVDPVFISNYDDMIPAIKSKRPYMLVYAYDNRIKDEREIAAIKAYAKDKGLEILSVGMQQRWCNNNITANAFELLSYVKGAECVVTDTFHGTVFSMKYNKRFVSLIRESNKNKLGGLLDQFDLSQRSVDNIDDIALVMDAEIDYAAVNEKIENEQKRSYKYLDEITSAEK